MASFGNAIQQVMVIKDKKVISNSKHLADIFKEAKAAYSEKKAELRSSKTANDPNRPRPQLIERSRTRSGTPSASSSRNPSREPVRHIQRAHTSHPSQSSRVHKPSIERGYSDSFYANEIPTRRISGNNTPRQPSGLRHLSIQVDRELAEKMQRMELTRRHSASSLQAARSPSATARRSFDSAHSFDSDIDMDLAYGELPPPLPTRPANPEQELKNKATALTVMLEEANCLQYSAKAIIKSLEKNPQQMAAVGLALVEISNLLTKMAPGALTTMKGAFPAIAALIMSPEFLIAAGVGVGITVVALGGYKIIKKIKAGSSGSDKLSEAEELEEISNVERIRQWRRGLTDFDDTASVTSVEGELMTPMAAAHYRVEGVIPPKEKKKDEKKDSNKKKKPRSKDTESKMSSKAGSSRTGKTEKKRSGKEREKSPSALRQIFKKL